MANFAPYQGISNPPTYLGLSKEVDKPKPNMAYKHLFEGLGDLFSGAVEVADTYQQNEIRKDAYANVDAVVNQDIENLQGQLISGTGVVNSGPAGPTPKTDATEQATGVTSAPIWKNQIDSEGNPLSYTSQDNSVPAEIDQGVTQVKRIQDAKMMKKGNAVLYEGQIHEIAQNMLSKYGIGYRDHIERALDAATNSRAAANRKALQDAVLALQAGRDSATKADETWLQNHVKYFLRPDGSFDQETYRAAVQNVGTTGFARFKEFGGRQQALEYSIKFSNDQLENETKTRGVNKDRASEVFQGNLDKMTAMTWNTAKMSVGKGQYSMSDITARMNQIKASGKQPNPMELGELARATAVIEDTWRRSVQSSAEAQTIDTGQVDQAGKPIKKSMVQMIGAHEVQRLIDEKAKDFARIKTDLGAGHTTLATSTATIQQQMGENDQFNLIVNSPDVRKARALADAAGPNGKAFLDAYYTAENYRPLADVNKALRDTKFLEYNFSKVDGGLEKAGEHYSAVNKGAKPTPDYLKSILNMGPKVLLDPAAPIENKVNMAANLSDPGTLRFLQKFNPTEQIDAWAALSQPGVAKGVKALGNEQVWQEYKTSQQQSMARLFNTYISNIRESVQYDPSLNARWNPDTGQIDYDRRVPTQARGAVPANANTVAIDRVNIALRTFSNILAEDGEKVTPEVLKSIGIDLTPKQSPAAQSIMDAIFGSGKGEGSTPKLFQKPNSGLEQNTPATPVAPTTNKRTSEAPNANTGPSTGSESQGLSLAFNANAESTAPAAPLKTLIRKGEADGSYNLLYGHGDQQLTSKTLNEVLAMQAESNKASTAAGGYQFLRRTLIGLKNELGLTGKEQFNEDLQDRLAHALMERRGLSQYLNGSITKEQFADRLAQEWAALPTSSGKSYYHGDGLNRSRVSRASLLKAIDKLAPQGES